MLDVFFKQDRYTVGGVAMNLSDYENTVIRAFEDPRLHVALNCMSMSCPPLWPEAFAADKLEQQLEAAMRAFVNDPWHLHFNADSHVLTLSKIIEWYRPDFPGNDNPSLISYLNDYLTTPISTSASVTWFAYDWTVINAQ